MKFLLLLIVLTDGTWSYREYEQGPRCDQYARQAMSALRKLPSVEYVAAECVTRYKA